MQPVWDDRWLRGLILCNDYFFACPLMHNSIRQLGCRKHPGLQPTIDSPTIHNMIFIDSWWLFAGAAVWRSTTIAIFGACR
jgi:hypothetical protein